MKFDRKACAWFLIGVFVGMTLVAFVAGAMQGACGALLDECEKALRHDR